MPASLLSWEHFRLANDTPWYCRTTSLLRYMLSLEHTQCRLRVLIWRKLNAVVKKDDYGSSSLISLTRFNHLREMTHKTCPLTQNTLMTPRTFSDRHLTFILTVSRKISTIRKLVIILVTGNCPFSDGSFATRPFLHGESAGSGWEEPKITSALIKFRLMH